MLNKLIAGIISLSIMLFSSYEGNEAKLTLRNSVFSSRKLILDFELKNAFENDFKEIFMSGRKVEICFSLTVKNDGKLLKKDSFCHTVLYDPLSDDFLLEFEETGKHIIVKSYQKMLTLISEVKYKLQMRFPETVKISFSAFLSNLKLSSIDKEYDLMLLWKKKKPKLNMILNRSVR